MVQLLGLLRRRHVASRRFTCHRCEVGQYGSQGITGMKKGEMKTVTFMTDSSFTRHMTVEEFQGIGGNYTEALIGDPFLLAFVENPVINLENTTDPDLYISRIGYVTGKDPDGVNINFGYASAEITLDQLNNK